MSTRAMPSGRPLGTSRLDLVGQQGDEGAVVEQPGQRVAPGRVHERRGLAGEPGLGGPEDQEEQGRGDERRGQRHEDDLAADVIEAGEDRHRVAPDADDAPDLAIDRDAAGTRAGPSASRGRPGAAAAAVGRADGGLGRARERRRRTRRRPAGPPAERRIAGRDDRAVGAAQLDAEDLAGPDQGRERGSEPWPGRRVGAAPARGRPADVGVDEGAGRRRVAADDVVEGGSSRSARRPATDWAVAVMPMMARNAPKTTSEQQRARRAGIGLPNTRETVRMDGAGRRWHEVDGARDRTVPDRPGPPWLPPAPRPIASIQTS